MRSSSEPRTGAPENGQLGTGPRGWPTRTALGLRVWSSSRPRGATTAVVAPRDARRRRALRSVVGQVAVAGLVALAAAAAASATARPAAAATARSGCRAAALVLSQYGTPTGLVANSAGLFRFTNRSKRACTIEGYPSFAAATFSGATLHQHAHDAGDYIYPDPPLRVVTLPPGASAYFAVGWTRGGPPDSCLGSPITSTTLTVTSDPPGTSKPLHTTMHTFQNYCAPVDVSVVATLEAFHH